MEIDTRYLGLRLDCPLVPSASPLSEEIGNLRKMEDVGAGAIVLHSLYEEQIEQEGLTLQHYLAHGSDSFAESLSYFPEPAEFRHGPDAYLEHVRRAKEAVRIPVIASLNGTTRGGWIDYARLIEAAGADALEVNLYHIPADVEATGCQVEERYLEVVRQVRSGLKIPLAVKIGPYFSALGEMARRLVEAGADVTMLCSALLRHGIDHLRTVKEGLIRLMEEHDYASVTQMKGSMSQRACADPTAFERASYMKALTGYHLRA